MTRKGNEPLAELVSFIESLGEPRILTDLDYRILAANKAYRDAYAPHGSVVGRHCYEVSHHYAVPCDEAGESARAGQRSFRNARSRRCTSITRHGATSTCRSS